MCNLPVTRQQTGDMCTCTVPVLVICLDICVWPAYKSGSHRVSTANVPLAKIRRKLSVYEIGDK